MRVDPFTFCRHAAFEGLDTYVLLKAAEVLAAQGKVRAFSACKMAVRRYVMTHTQADVFPGDTPDEHGVKFKAPGAP